MDTNELLRFDSAFAFLGQPATSELARRVLIFIALNTEYKDSRARTPHTARCPFPPHKGRPRRRKRV